ncbi:uroporphyrinogen-III synthase [Psychrobacter sp. B38]|uniref:uroporphyrinogen-III synthase n=1 Tax=Psychrobacter sp. B38 TaxID=3143538 RepID=UPI00320F5FB0
MSEHQSVEHPLPEPRVVINTRPVERAALLTQHLQAAGLAVAEMPMLALQSRPTTDDDVTKMHQWLIGEYKALVIVSPTAAASGLAVWQTLEREVEGRPHEQEVLTVFGRLKSPSPLIAVGDATATVLNHAHLDTASYPVRQPKTANNEGMLAMPEIERLQAGDKVLIWRGLGGRRLLVDALQARGVHVDSIAWYERVMPIAARVQYQAWRQAFLTRHAKVAPSKQTKPIVVISSGTAFEHWMTVVNETSVASSLTQSDCMSADDEMQYQQTLTLSDFTYIVLGARLTNQVAKQQLDHWQVDDLAPETILAAINATT